MSEILKSPAWRGVSLGLALSLLALFLVIMLPAGWAQLGPRSEQNDLLFHDRFKAGPGQRTLQFNSGRVDSRFLNDGAFFGNFLITGYVPGIDSGLSLYRFGRDEPGVSNCTGGCASAWPPLMIDGPNALIMPGGFLREVGVIERKNPDGWQVTLDGWPLYLYDGDKQPGDTQGHMSGDGIWQLIVVSQVTSPPPEDIALEDHETWQRGLNAWRMPRPMIGACVNCHSPDAYDIARVGFSHDDIRRRAIGDGLGEAEAEAIVDLVELQRDRYRMTGANAPFEPMAFRPLQPGGLPLEGANEDERELAFIRHLREDHKLDIVSQRIGTIAEARQAAEQLANLDLNTVRVGFPFERFSEDSHHGRAHDTFLDWIPFAPHEVVQAHNKDWYALQDAYIANPSTETLLPLIEKVGQYTTTCRFLVNRIDPEDCNPDDGFEPAPGDPYGVADSAARNVSEQDNPVRTRTWNNFRYRNILLLQHMMREENQRLNDNPDDPTAGLMYLPSIHREDFFDLSDHEVNQHIKDLNSRFNLWDLAEFARTWIPNDDTLPFPPAIVRDRIDYDQALDSHLTETAIWQRRGSCKDHFERNRERCYWILNVQGLRASWFWMGFAQDTQALIRKESHEYFHQTANMFQDIRLHTMFATFTSLIHRSYRHDTIWRGTGPHTSYKNVRHLNQELLAEGGMRFSLNEGWQTTDLSEERLEEHRLLWGNINRMTLLLWLDEVSRTGRIHRRDNALTILNGDDKVSIYNALIGGCHRNDHRYCVEDEAYRDEIADLIVQLEGLIRNADESSWSEIRRLSEDSQNARHIFGEYNRLGVGENAIGVPAAPIPRIDRPGN